MCLGGDGLISVIANCLPGEVSKMIREAKKGNLESARMSNQSLTPFYELGSKEGNPASVKAGLESIGICERTVRLPLAKADERLRTAFRQVLNKKKGIL